MLIVAGTFDVDPERREEFLASRTEAIKRSRGETGCLDYTFSADFLDPGRVRLFEIWESRADLEAHQAANRAAPSRAVDVPVHARNVTYYEIATSEPSPSNPPPG
jgi:quinol monooxygenase YgiN